MLKMLKYLDGALIDCVFQPAANRLQDWGSPKQISMFCLMGFLVTLGATIALEAATQHTLNVVDGVLFLLGPAIYYSSGIHDFTSKARNPLRVMPLWIAMRVFVLLLFVGLTGSDIIVGFSILSFVQVIRGMCMVSQFYFEACDKPPPPVSRQVTGLAWARSS